jgi:curved DNA-binding protein CbpA
MTETFYDVLGVAEDATTDEIETAYRERLKETHPDVSDDDDAGRATKALIEARDVLVDEDERARYDRLGHDAYVGSDAEPSGPESTTDQSESSESGTSATESTAQRTESRARRERRASERVSRERQRAREARQKRRQARTERTRSQRTTDEATAATSASTDRTGSSTGRRRSHGAGTASATGSGNTYSVREDVTTTRSYGRLLPSGRELTLLGIFFALYPVLLFTAVLPAFPPFVNLVLGACTLLTISYLQSMPRVAVPLFGGWSAISIVALVLFQVGLFSAVGIVVLCGTVLPFGLSVLTASALRF